MIVKLRLVSGVVAGVIFTLCLQACAGKDKPFPAEQQQADVEALRMEAVAGEDRASQAAILVEQLASITRRAGEDQLAFQEQYRILNRNYTASRADFEQFFSELNRRIEQRQNEAVSVRQ